MHQTANSASLASFSSICLAFLNRYPSPLSPHILYQDTLHQFYDADNNTLTLYKLVRKSGKLPKWAPKISIAETWVLEETRVDLVQGIVHSSARNIDLTSYCVVKEKLRIEELERTKTLLQVSAEATSSYQPPITSLAPFAQARIANYAVKSYVKRIPKTRASLQLIHTLLCNPSSPYRNNVLFPDRSPAIPADLLKSRLFVELTKGFQHWEDIGAGFSGHGIEVEPGEKHFVQPDKLPPKITKRPEFLEPTNFAWWLSRFRPQVSLESPFSKEKRAAIWEKVKARANRALNSLAFWREASVDRHTENASDSSRKD